MKYIFGINESGEAKQLATAISPYNEVVTQDYYPAREYRPGYRAVLKYDVEQGVYWDYVLIPASEKREHAYETYKCITYEGALLTVDEANKLWQEYEAEGSSLAAILTDLIAAAKTNIREMYPDEILESEEVELAPEAPAAESTSEDDSESESNIEENEVKFEDESYENEESETVEPEIEESDDSENIEGGN